MNNSVKFENGATKQQAEEILRRIKNDIGYREQEILSDLDFVEMNTEVPAGYIQYRFYNKEGNGFQAGKYANGNWGITL